MLLGLLTGVCFAQRASQHAAPSARPAPNKNTVAPNATTAPDANAVAPSNDQNKPLYMSARRRTPRTLPTLQRSQQFTHDAFSSGRASDLDRTADLEHSSDFCHRNRFSGSLIRRAGSLLS